MRSVSSEYAAAHLDELLQAVGSGEQIEITEEGRPVARLVPAGTSAASDRQDDVEAPSEEVEQAFHGD